MQRVVLGMEQEVFLQREGPFGGLETRIVVDGHLVLRVLRDGDIGGCWGQGWSFIHSDGLSGIAGLFYE